jgi:hypothetical protein
VTAWTARRKSSRRTAPNTGPPGCRTRRRRAVPAGRVIADTVDEGADRGYGLGIVTCNAKRAPVHGAKGSGTTLELVVPDVVERLDDGGVCGAVPQRPRSFRCHRSSISGGSLPSVGGQ